MGEAESLFEGVLPGNTLVGRHGDINTLLLLHGYPTGT